VTNTGEDRSPRRLGQRYEIRVAGVLGDTLRSAFPDLRVRVDGGDSLIEGVFIDQAALYGVICLLEELRLELMAVRRLA
jgi:hypothetical protein